MNLKCPNLLTIFDLKTSDSGDTFVVMEYVAGPSLASVLRQYPAGLPMAEVRHWLKGLVEGVAYLHDHGIVHRDLKPANLFMEEGIVKIGDYGLAKLITPSQGTEHSESIGTCHYMAPEIGSGKYHKPIDIYAMGVILYEMLTGRVPFEGETVNEVLMKHLTARPDVSSAAPAVSGDRGQGTGQGPQPPDQPGFRPAASRGCSADPRGPDHRRWQGRARARRLRRQDGDGSRPAQDDILRIEAEEPIFYIGPDTRPPIAQARNLIAERIRANWEALRRPARYRSSPSARAANRAVAPQAGSRCKMVRFDRPLMLGRVAKQPTRRGRRPAAGAASAGQRPGPNSRTGGVDALGRSARGALDRSRRRTLLGIDLSSDPQQLAFLYGMALLGTWTTLVPNKLIEARKARRDQPAPDRLAAGLLVGGGRPRAGSDADGST